MPTYEFRCPDGTIVEKTFKMSEVPDAIPNPLGDGEAVRIISGGAGLLFKGTGFYITDYGKDGKKDQRAASNETAAAGATPKAEGKGESKADSKGESKSEAKPESAKPAAAPSGGTGSSTAPGSSSSGATGGSSGGPAKGDT